MPFEPEGLGAEIFRERYAQPGESWDAACARIAAAAAAAEPEEARNRLRDEFHGELTDGRFMPGGRIWYGAGRPVQQLLNCFVIPTKDTREGWARAASDLLITAGMGGGVGADLSPIRPRGAPVRGMGGNATGPVSLMRLLADVGRHAMDGGSRRLALMFCLDIDHPDIEEFLAAKAAPGELRHANLSAIIPARLRVDRFQSMVAASEPLPLRFGRGAAAAAIPADELWHRLIDAAWRTGEPGVLNQHHAESANSLAGTHPLIATNPCGEIWLPRYGCCALGALVLPRFVSAGTVLWDELAASARRAVRFLDDVLSVARYPLPAMRRVARSERRIGLGVMGLHSLLMALGLRYSTSAARATAGEVMAAISRAAYEASAQLAQERGAFPLFEPRHAGQGFMAGLDPPLQERIRSTGIRNCALLAVAPTGATSIVQGVTPGIEPLFAPAYIRRRGHALGRDGRSRRATLVLAREYRRYRHVVEGAYDIAPADHLAMQAAVQRHVDNAVSKTVNVRDGVGAGTLARDCLERLPEIKGLTIYREGARADAPFEAVPAAGIEATLTRFGDAVTDDGGVARAECARCAPADAV